MDDVVYIQCEANPLECRNYKTWCCDDCIHNHMKPPSKLFPEDWFDTHDE